MKRFIYSTIAAAITVAAVAGCSPNSMDRISSDATVAALHQPGRTTAVVRITADHRYFVNGELTAEIALTNKLKQAIDPDVTKPYTARIVAEKGVTGYYAVMAQNAARDAGFSRIEGYAEVSADPKATIAGAQRWTQDLNGPAGAAGGFSVRDTSRGN